MINISKENITKRKTATAVFLFVKPAFPGKKKAALGGLFYCLQSAKMVILSAVISV